MTNKKHRRSWIWQIAASLCCLWLAGCGGGGGSLPGVTANYEGGNVLLNLRVGELQLQRRSNQLTGTMTVSRVTDSAGDNPRQYGTLPVGTYQISATVTDNNFSGQGRYLGSPAFNFTVNGVLPTASTMGLVTITGSTAQGAFNYDIGFRTASGLLGQDGTFSVSNLQNTNAVTTPLANTVNAGFNFPLSLNLNKIYASFSAPPDSPRARTLEVIVDKATPFAVGDEIPIRANTTQVNSAAQVFYSENSPVTRQWYADSGSVKITGINGEKVTLQLINVQMQPQQQIGNQPNQGTGQFTLNGSGSVMMDYPVN